MAGLFDHPTTPPLRAVIANVRDGSLLIPNFQRPFVWRDEQRLNLLDSVARGLPIGALLVWRTRAKDTDGEAPMRTHEKLGPFPLPAVPQDPPWTYLIDGHQRLTTLYAALYPVLEEWNDPDSDVRWPIYLDLEIDPTTQGRFFVLRRDSDRPTLVPAGVLLSNRLVYERQQELWKQGNNAAATRLEQVADAFKDYPIPVVPMITEDISIVTQAFARINTSGTKMSEVHLAAALSYGKLELHRILKNAVNSFEDRGWRIIDQGALLDLFKIRFQEDVYRSDIKKLLDKLGAKERDNGKLLDYVSEAENALNVAISVLESVPVFGPEALPYKYQLLLLADALRRAKCLDTLSDDVQAKAVRWFWQTTFTEYFTGATGQMIRQAGDDLTEYLTGAKPPAFEARVVRASERRRKWGAVRTLGQTLASLAASEANQDAARLLGMLGSAAVHKLHPKMDSKRMGAWVVTASHELRTPESWSAQLAPAALAAYHAGDFGRCLDLQDAYVRSIEIKMIESVGLVVAPASA